MLNDFLISNFVYYLTAGILKLEYLSTASVATSPKIVSDAFFNYYGNDIAETHTPFRHPIRLVNSLMKILVSVMTFFQVNMQVMPTYFFPLSLNCIACG